MSAPNRDRSYERTDSLMYLRSDSENDSVNERERVDDDESAGSLRDFIAADDDSEVAAARRPPLGFHILGDIGEGDGDGRNHSSSDDEHSEASNERRRRERQQQRRFRHSQVRADRTRTFADAFEEDYAINEEDDDDVLARSPPLQRARILEQDVRPLVERVARCEEERAALHAVNSVDQREMDRVVQELMEQGPSILMYPEAEREAILARLKEEIEAIDVDQLDVQQKIVFQTKIDMYGRYLRQENLINEMKLTNLRRQLIADVDGDNAAAPDPNDGLDESARVLRRFRQLFSNRNRQSDNGVPATVYSTYRIYVPDDSEEQQLWRVHEIQRGDRLPIKKQTYHGGNRALQPFKDYDRTRRIRGLNIEQIGREDDEEDVEEVLEHLRALVSAFCIENNIQTALNSEDGISPPPNNLSYIQGDQRLYSTWIRQHAGIGAEEYLRSGQLGMTFVYRNELRPIMFEHYNEMRITVWRAQRLLARFPQNGVDEAVELLRDSVRQFIRHCELVHCSYLDLCNEFIADTRRHLRNMLGVPGFDDFRLPMPPSLYEEVTDPIGDGSEKNNDVMEIKDALRYLATDQRLRRVVVSRTEAILFRPVYTRDTRKFCYCYEEDGSVDEWVWSAIDEHFTRREERLFESTKGTAESVQIYFRLRKGLVDLVTTRHMMSFRNGVYIVPRAEFIPYEEMDDSRLVAPNVYSCMYIDKDFDPYPRLHHVELPFPAPPNPRHQRPQRSDTVYDIPTPAFDRIMHDQRWPYEVRVAMYVTIGRCLYDLEYLDRDQKVAFCAGLRSTGKSTIIKLVSMFYPRHLQCSMGTNGETVFGLQATVDKFLVTNSEVTKNWNLSTSDFLKMVASDVVNVPRKNRMALDMCWRAPLLLAGNEFMGWNDDHGAVARRLLIFMFTEVISVDPTLEDQLRDELPRIIHKCNRYYLAATCHYGNRAFQWPRYFEEQRLRFMSSSSPLFAFLFSSEVVYGDPEQYYVPYEKMLDAYNAFVNRDAELKHNKRKRDQHVWRGALHFVNVTILKDPVKKRYPNIEGGGNVEAQYVLGMDLAIARRT